MRHRVAKKKLGKTASHRKALARNLAEQVIVHGSIETTLAKAKWIKPYVEKVITKAKVTPKDKGVKHNLVVYVRQRLATDEGTKKLIEEVAPKYNKVNGGYTRITKLPQRDGDKAKMGRIELVEVKTPRKDTKEKAKKVENKTEETIDE